MRRKKGNVTSTNAADTLQNDLKSCLLHLMDPPISDSRRDLLTLLQKFSSISEDEEYFFNMESLATEIRKLVSLLLEELLQEKIETFDLHRELQDITSTSQNSLDFLIWEYNYKSFLKQITFEEHILDQIVDNLDSLYSDSYDCSDCSVWIHHLSERTYLKQALLSKNAEENYFPREMQYPVMDNHHHDTFPDSLHEKSANSCSYFDVTSQSNLCELVDQYLTPHIFPTKVILLLGPTGSGKTHLCHQIINKTRNLQDVSIIHPLLPIDIMGPNIGDTEYSLNALFHAASTERKYLIILDDVHSLLSHKEEREAFDFLRIRLDFMSHLDRLHTEGKNTLLIATSTDNMEETLRRFDRTFHLTSPDHGERISMIRSCLEIHDTTQEFEESLQVMANCLLGRSRAEISQFCRQAVQREFNSSAVGDSYTRKSQLLSSMTSELSQLVPESLRVGVIDCFIDMNVFSASMLNQPGLPTSLPLVGDEVNDVWRNLEALIITPLCHANALNEILGGIHANRTRNFCGGVLLTGEPGTGKTTIAYHAAHVACNRNPSIKLLDVSCNSLIHKEVGGSERAVRRLFEAVRAASPCILLLDGIESIAGRRGMDNTTHGTMDRVLSTLLIELDGVGAVSEDKEQANFAIIGITHSSSMIDSALCRPGRLEKIIKMQKPGWVARKQIALTELLGCPIDDSVDLGKMAGLLADGTPGKSGAEIIAVCQRTKTTCASFIIDSYLLGSSNPSNQDVLLKEDQLMDILAGAQDTKSKKVC
jgi:SpoVK/Ycf46/Vps4 family AAA+-type ATPase